MEAEARVRPRLRNAAASKKMEETNPLEAPGRSAPGQHSCLARFGFPTSTLEEDKRVSFGATQPVAICHSSHRTETQPPTLPSPAVSSPGLLRLLFRPLSLGSGRTQRFLCFSKLPPHASLHPAGT